VTVSKGQAWGVSSPLPSGAAVVASDSSLAAASDATVGLVGGDLCRTLGGRGDGGRLTSPEAVTFPVDALAVLLDDAPPVRAVAHVVARSWGWGRCFVAMNAQWLGEWNVAPRGHPDDGRVETLSWTLSWRAARQVIARMPQGAHLPHPGITASSVASASVAFDRPRRVWIDGVLRGRARTLTVVVEPDALRVVV
jgi:diacylglycerol kinase family enzyme